MGTTLPALDPINIISGSDLFLMTHSNGEGYKLPGSALTNLPLLSFWQDANNKDPLAIVESFVTTNAYSRFISFRMGNSTSNNTPYGSNVDTDFFYQAYIIESKEYCIMTAYDVRSNRCYRISKVSGTWGNWELIGTETIYTGTFNDTISSGGYNFSSLQKSGRQVDFVCRFVKESSTTFSQRTIIGTVPQGFRPNFIQPVVLINFDTNVNITQYITIQTDGNVWLELPMTVDRVDMYMNISWFTNE